MAVHLCIIIHFESANQINMKNLLYTVLKTKIIASYTCRVEDNNNKLKVLWDFVALICITYILLSDLEWANSSLSSSSLRFSLHTKVKETVTHSQPL